jgi:hypothetical protein
MRPYLFTCQLLPPPFTTHAGAPSVHSPGLCTMAPGHMWKHYTRGARPSLPSTPKVPGGLPMASFAILSASILFSLKTCKKFGFKVLVTTQILSIILFRLKFFGSDPWIIILMIVFESPTTFRLWICRCFASWSPLRSAYASALLLVSFPRFQ